MKKGYWSVLFTDNIPSDKIVLQVAHRKHQATDFESNEYIFKLSPIF